MAQALVTLAKTIKALIDKGDQAADKAEQFYKSAGQHLKTLIKQKPEGVAVDDFVKEQCGIGKSRAYDLIGIADGTKTLEQVRAGAVTRMKRVRGKTKAKSKGGVPSRGGKNPKGKSGNGQAAEESDGGDDLDAPVVQVIDGDSDPKQFYQQAFRFAMESIQHVRAIDFDLDDYRTKVKPTAADWQKLREYVRETADLWSKLAHRIESTKAPATDRVQSLLPEKMPQADDYANHNV